VRVDEIKQDLWNTVGKENIMLAKKKMLVFLGVAIVAGVSIVGSGVTLCNRDCPWFWDNFWCPSSVVCLPAGHCGIGVPHNFVTAFGLKTCVWDPGDTCTICSTCGCKYDWYALGDTTCTTRISSGLNALCYNICNT
jgi:hypothetical protein